MRSQNGLARAVSLSPGTARRLQRAAYLVAPCIAMHVACAFADVHPDSEDGRPSSFVTARPVGRGTLEGARCMLTDESLVALLRAEGIIPLPAFEQGRAVERPPLLRGTSRPESAGTGTSQLTASSGIIELADDKGDVSVTGRVRTGKGGWPSTGIAARNAVPACTLLTRGRCQTALQERGNALRF